MPDDQKIQDLIAKGIAAGLDDNDIALVVEEYKRTQAPAGPKDYAQFGPMADLYRGQDEAPARRAWAMANAPALLAGAAAMASGPGIVLPAIAAAGGGFLGARLRGDSRADAAGSGAIEGLTQVGGGAAAKGLARAAKATMRAAVPKQVAKDFSDVDLPAEMLRRGAFPGSEMSARRIAGLSRAANAERLAAAETVPTISWSQAAREHIPLYDKAVLAGKPKRASRVVDSVRTIQREIGSGVSGPAALARKDILQDEGAAAIKGSSKKSSLNAKLANAERKALVAELRKTPRMATALDESQALKAIDAIMRDASHSNLLTRFRTGGVGSALISPIGASGTAHALDQGQRVVNPNALRLLRLVMGDQE